MTTATLTKPYKKDGIWHYPELPDGMRQATLIDFNIITPELVFGINILLQSADNYQARIIRNATDLKKFSPDIVAGKVFVDKLPYKEQGLWYYPSKPLGCRNAVFSDFLTSDHEIKTGIDFLVLGSFTTEYEAHRTGTIERFVDWLDWIPAGRVFIKPN